MLGMIYLEHHTTTAFATSAPNSHSLQFTHMENFKEYNLRFHCLMRPRAANFRLRQIKNQALWALEVRIDGMALQWLISDGPWPKRQRIRTRVI